MNVLVTGASNGLGAEICKWLLKSGFTVYGVSRSVVDYGDRYVHITYDLKDTKNIKRDIFSKIDRVDYLINNAGVAYDDIVSNANIDKLNEMYAVNVISPVILTKYAIRNFILNKHNGCVINISSVCAHTGYKGLSMYASTKGALEAFSKGVAREWGYYGIRSNCVVPGFMETNMTDGMSDENRGRAYNRTSLKRATNIMDVVNAVEFLILNSSITGQNIFVDSGTI